MTDPESREPILRETPVDPVYVYQIEYPLGIIYCIIAHSALEASTILNDSGVEPFMIRRAGLLMGGM